MNGVYKNRSATVEEEKKDTGSPELGPGIHSSPSKVGSALWKLLKLFKVALHTVV